MWHQLNALSNSNNAVFSWSHADSLTTGTAFVQPTETFIYQVSAVDTVTLCSAEDFLRIIVDKTREVYIPNIFSPNGDGTNDSFFLRLVREFAVSFDCSVWEDERDYALLTRGHRRELHTQRLSRQHLY